MVTLNFTLVVNLIMFLVFLWAMNTFVFRPLFKVMDTRDARMAEDHETAKTAGTAAAQLEKAYASKVAALHRDETRKVRDAHWEAQAAHNKRVAELKEREEAELDIVRADAMDQVNVERRKYAELVETLSGQVAERLNLEGTEH